MAIVKEFILSTAVSYFNCSKNDFNSDDDVLVAFINEPHNLTLCIILRNNKIEFQKEVSYENLGSLIFYKTKQITLENDESLKHVGITAIPENPIESFYLSLRHIYGPLLQANESFGMGSKIQETMMFLEGSLRTLAYGKDGGPSLLVLLSVDDELQYWKKIAEDTKVYKQKEMADAFVLILASLSQEIGSLEIAEAEDVAEIMENISGLLDDLWRHSLFLYPQGRMVHLMDIIGNNLMVKLQNILNIVDIWSHNENSSSVLTSSSESTSMWIKCCRNLTQKYWPNHSLHAWEGPPYIPQLLKKFHDRINEVADTKSIHIQLSKLLSTAEQEDLNLNEMFSLFQNINVWQCTPQNNALWMKSKAQFEKKLKPAEEIIAQKLHIRFNNLPANQMIYEFSKYISLIERSSVLMALSKERQILISFISQLLKNIESEIGVEKSSAKNEFVIPGISMMVQQIQWTKRMEGKVIQIEHIVNRLLIDLDGSEDILSQAKAMKKKLSDFQIQIYEDWTRDVQSEILNKSLVLSSETPVIEFFGENNFMRVTFNPRLVTLERDVRHMGTLGFIIPSNIRETVSNASKFMEHARSLQQIASFHNTQGERMIISQRPMMLSAAIQLDSLVKEQTAVPWKDVDQVFKYVEKLKNAVDNLSKQNLYLTSQHILLRNIVLTLMDTNLLQNQTDWKKAIRQMRDIIDKVESNGYSNTKSWINHWDIQIYKALEHQYRSALIDPLSHLPVVKVELIFRQQGIQLQPSLEEVRATCHTYLKKLIALPLHFIGLQNVAVNKESVFSSIVYRNNWMISGAMIEIESTLEKVMEVVQKWKKWGALGSVDLDNLCDIHLCHPADWEKNFKDCKALGQTIAKLPMEDEQVDWIWISSASLRNDLEIHNRRYWIALSTSLQSSLQRDIATIEAFYLTSHNIMNQTIPKTPKELGTANEEFNALKQKQPQIIAIFDGLRRKQNMVRIWCGERVRSLESLTKQWENVSSQINNYEKLIAHQAASVKSNLLTEWSNLSEKLEIWYARWSQTRPKPDQLTQNTYVELETKFKIFQDANENWKLFNSEKENIINECVKFNEELEITSVWGKVENKMTQDISFWEPFNKFSEDLSTLGDQEWSVFQTKLHLLDEFIYDWNQKLEPYTPITLFIKNEIDKYKETMPILKNLRGNNFTEKHWREIFSIIDIPAKPVTSLILYDFLNATDKIKKNSKSIQKIWTSASHEAIIREAVAELELWLAGTKFTLIKHTDVKGKALFIIKDFKDIITKIEEYQNLAGSAHAAGEANSGDSSVDQLTLWENRLSQMKTALTSLGHIQRKWIYLEPILLGDIIQSGSMMKNDIFARVDRDFRHVMRIVESDPRLSALTNVSNLSSLLASLINRLVQCQNMLEHYMADKRSVFPRFYFLSDDDLLELLGQVRTNSSNKDVIIQTHIKKIFPGAIGVVFGPENASITGMKGQNGEKLMLDIPVDIETPIEVWLHRLEVQMRESLHTNIKQCLLHFEIQKQNIASYPAQVLCLVQSIHFTENVERFILSHNLHEMKGNVQEELNKYLKLKIHESDEILEESKLQALILQCYHHLQVVNDLIDSGISSPKQWLWQKQLRFYVESKTAICACMGLAKIPYTYEFLGTNIGNLVHTELTDQCFLTLTQALHLGMVGNPFGPAGTGKTESVKALGGLLGRLVLVFNCDEGMDNTTMGRLLSGLALCGAWGCFDEFNRLEEKTLSAVIQQFSSILDAINPKKQQISAVLNTTEVKVLPGCGIFATMNPASAKYGGRRVLPEGLNRLFRPCAMCEPHSIHILSALLAAQGFSNSVENAEKIVLCFEMAKSLLSKSHHYDWGLRALKTIIGSSGSAIKNVIISSKSYPDSTSQTSLIIQALRVNTLSKLSHSDSKRFENILEALFPNENNKILLNEKLALDIKAHCDENNINISDNQIRRCGELYDQLKQRMGVAIVGPPGCGKTFLRNILKDVLSKSGDNINQHIICPKSLNRKDLLGYIDNDTRQWYDGVISTVSLQVASEKSDIWSWIVCDGDVDPEWIESLNSVLDDNRLLTLPSGWRIQFMKNVNFIFETHDLKYASPATITRMGIILISAKESCYKEVIQKWSNEMKSNEEISMLDEKVLIDTIGKVLDWTEKNSNDFLLQYEKIPLTKQILSFINGYDGIISIDEHLSTSILKALSCVLKPESIERFLELVSQWTNVSPHAIMWNNSKDRESQLESFSIGNDFFLMNERIYKIINLIHTWIDDDQHFMLFGPPSSGKSLILDYMLKDVRDKIIINLKCTPILDVQHIIQVLKQKSVVKSGNSKSNGRVVLVIKALQRTVSDKWNTSRVQSFLLQLVQYGGFWEKSDETDGKMQWFTLIPFSLIVTCTVEDGSIKLSQRLTNSLKVINLVAPNNKELLEVSELYLSNSLSKLDMPNEDKIKLMQFSPRMVSLFEEVSKIFNTEIHYKWTSRDIIKWCQNMCHYKIENFDMAYTIIIKEALNIFKNRLKSNKEKHAFDTLIQKHFGSFSLHMQMFLPKMTNIGLKLELVDENEYSSSIIKMINQCNSQVDNDAFGEIGAEFCDELKELVSVAIRVLCQSEIVVFIGVAGVGRRASAKIAAEFFSAKFIIISTPQQFFLNLKSILTTCGSDCTPELVVLEESAASDPNVLGLIEALLSKGESASYLSFYIQEIESMVSQMKSNVGKKTVQKFMENVSMNLGIVLIYDVKQPDLKDLFSSYPILYKQSQLYWLDGWSDNTLKDVAIQITKRVLSEEQGLNDCLSIISTGKTMEMFSSLNQDNLKTPYRYIIFLKTYFNIYFERKQFLEEKYKRLKSGVSALIEAKEEVSKMKSNAAQQQKILAEKQTLANTALNQIGTTMQSASVHKQEMETLKNKAEIENLKLQERKKEIEIELSEVEPVIQEARTAVGDIRPESLSEVRSLRAPPEPVRDVLEGVLRLMGIADTSWHSMKTFLSKRSIKDEIKLFDASNISQENLRAVEKLLSTHGASFSEKTAKRASVACAPLAAWVVANVKYANVLHKIAPLEAEQRTLSHNLANAESQIKDLSSDLFTVDERVSALKLELNTYTKQATEIEIGLSSVQTTIEKAEELVSKLSKEFQRWNENLSDLSNDFNEISMKSFIMAGFIAYLTHEIEENKNLIMNEWCKLFDKLSDINIKELFISRNNEIEWVDKGLSSNFASFCNGIIINDTLKEPKRGLVPLIIDPNNEAIQWLSNITEKQPKDIISQNDPKLITILQHALRFGKIFIIKDVTSIDDTWSPLLRNQVPLNIGVNSINPAFRLMLFTRGSKFLNALSVYHKSLLSIVNFTPQKQGLIDQLVFNAVKQEEPELQTKLSEINAKKDKLQVQQDSLEVELLTQLSSGNILQNPDLLESLEHTQKAVNEITSSLKEAADIAAVIKNQCNFYRSVASRVASVCLAISSLTRNFPLININLNTAVKLFLKGLENFRGSINKNESNFENIGKYVVVSLLERVLVASNKKFHPSILIYLMHHTFPENIPQNEWEVIMCNPDTFIYGQADNNSLNEIPEWIDLDRKPYLCAIKTYAPEFYSVLQLENENIWRKFISTADWELIPNFDNITPFQKVLIAWALKPTKLSSFLTKATSQILGSNQFYFSGNLISSVENWGSINQPILVIGAAGTDPIDEIKTRATTIVGPNKFKQAWISEIGSSDTIVENLKNEINWAKDSGGWLAIMVPAGDWPQNEVYQILSDLHMSSSSDSIAKIWIVAENSSIPYQLASCCVNVIVEAPTGIKNNLLRILSVWQSQGIVESKSINPKQIRLEFSLALAHSVIQQRCNYIPQGWRHLYNFSWGDLEACLASVRESDRSIAAGLCKVFYNGRIHWEQDMNLMSSLLDKHFDESVLGHTWKPLGLDVSLPMTSKLQDYITALANFSSIDNPTLLNLPNNIQTVHEQIEANNDLTNLRLLTLEEIIHDSNNATIRKKLSPILSLWKKLNANSQSLLRVEYNLDVDDHLSGLKVLTICEFETAKSAMKNIHKDLVALYTISTSSDKEKHSLALSLISDNTPDSWLEHWNSGPSSANTFIAGLCERAEIAQKRFSKQNDDKSLFVLSLSSFLKPECIIHALIWESSRRLSVAPESLTPLYKWDDNEPDASSGKVILKDLWLEGGIWENGRLQPCRTDTEIQIKAPPISLRFVVKGPNEFVNKNQAELPVFTSRERKKVIFKVNVSFAEQFNKSVWLLNSTALIIS